MSKKVVTGLVRFSFFNVFKARLNDLSGKTEFSTQILVPKTDTATVAALKAAIAEAVKDKFGGKRPPGLRNPLRDGDEPVAEGAKELGPEYAGHYFLSAKCSEDKPPQIVDHEGQDILVGHEWGSGDYGRASITAFAYDMKVNKGVSFWLNNLQLLDKGDSLGGDRADAVSDFATPIAGRKVKAVAKSVKAIAPAETTDEDENDDWA